MTAMPLIDSPPLAAPGPYFFGHRWVADPIKFAKVFWPHRQFYRQQKEIIYSVVEDDETVCVAGNELGKDFVAGFLFLYFFLTRSPVRIVTTSAKDDHLRVLWAEINRFIQECQVPLDYKKGGPLIINHQDIRKVHMSGRHKGEKCPLSYGIGMVASQEAMAAMQGHHIADTGDGIPRTFFIADECSSVPHHYKRMIDSWSSRRLLIGNAWECQNFFRFAVEGNPATGDPGGNVPREGRKGGYHRRVIHIEALDSPNVRYALAQEAKGIEPSGEVIIEGVKTWDHYVRDLKLMDPIQQCVSLRAQFYKGKEMMMFPQEWLGLSRKRARLLARNRTPRIAESMGIDPGEGSANTVWTIIDYLGIIKQISKKTPRTNEIIGETIGLMQEYNLPSDMVYFDHGGGGKQIADILREKGYDVQTVGFGEPVSAQPGQDRVDSRESRYSYFNRRAEMYMGLRNWLDPDAVERRHIPPTEDELMESLTGVAGVNHSPVEDPSSRPIEDPYDGIFAIPLECSELVRQLSAIPLRRDEEGRVKMIPKSKRNSKSKELTLEDLLGCSPDEADSTVLAIYGLSQGSRSITVGAI